MAKWQTRNSKYKDIDVVRQFHRHTMHLKANFSENRISEISYDDYKRTAGNVKMGLETADDVSFDNNLLEVIQRRRTSWNFEKNMDRKQLAFLLEKSLGVTTVKDYQGRQVYLRAYPSAGALYSVIPMVYINKVEADLNGLLFEYVPESNELYVVREASLEVLDDLTSTTKFTEKKFSNASIVMFFLFNFKPIFKKYSALSYRLGLLEAGHMSSSCQMIATAMGYSAVPVGGFYDVNVNRFLKAGKNEFCLYILPVG